MKLIVESPLNSLSFGNVNYNIMKEFYNKKIEVGYFPVGEINLSSFDIPIDFKNWIQESINKRWDILESKAPAFKLWHLNGAESRKSGVQNLFTFYECSNPTKQEIAICKSQDKTIFSSSYAKEKFEQSGCDNCIYIPLGFDSDFSITNKKYIDGVIHFGLMGKFENRKHTAKIIKTWLSKYGNDNRYQLTCCITNPFFKPEQMQSVLSETLSGKRYTNINFLPYLKTNKEVNELLNSIDIDLTGLSGGEGWNLPAFNATCLGKWSIVLAATSHLDWATFDNCILVQPNGLMSSNDGFFFSEGSDYNQGDFYTWSVDDVVSAMDVAVSKCKTQNKNGLELASKLTYSNTVDSIITSFS
jgi:hypothetical protein